MASSVITVSADVFLVWPQTEGKVPHSLTREMWVGVFTWIQCKISTAFDLDYLHQMVSCNVTLIRSNSKHCDLAKKKIKKCSHTQYWMRSSGHSKEATQQEQMNVCKWWPHNTLSTAFGEVLPGRGCSKQYRNDCNIHYVGAPCYILLTIFFWCVKCNRKQKKRQQKPLGAESEHHESKQESVCILKGWWNTWGTSRASWPSFHTVPEHRGFCMYLCLHQLFHLYQIWQLSDSNISNK